MIFVKRIYASTSYFSMLAFKALLLQRIYQVTYIDIYIYELEYIYDLNRINHWTSACKHTNVASVILW